MHNGNLRVNEIYNDKFLNSNFGEAIFLFLNFVIINN
jgi:hypothetical protein